MDDYFKLIENVYLPTDFETIKDEIYEMEVHDSDVWVCTFPKSGTTWTQEMVWLLLNKLDFKLAKETPLFKRFPFLESSSSADWMWLNEIYPNDYSEYSSSVRYVKDFKGRRFIKSHLPWHLLPKQIQNGEKKPKIIYVTRDPKDVCVSFYNYFCNVYGFDLTFVEFLEQFLKTKLIYTPYWEHIWSFHDNRESENIKFIKFEEMKSNLRSVIETLVDFLKIDDTITDVQMCELLKHLSFNSMKDNASVNEEKLIEHLRALLVTTSENASFMRTGKIGDYKNYFDAKMKLEFDEWVQDNLSKRGIHLKDLPVCCSDLQPSA